MSGGYHQRGQGNDYEACEPEAGQQQIQAYYDDADYDARNQVSHWRSNHHSRRDFPDHTYDEQYHHSYSYGHENNYWNQSYSAWATGGYPERTYYQGNFNAPYNYTQFWGTEGYPYLEDTYAEPDHYDTWSDFERPPQQQQDPPAVDIPPRSLSPSYLATSLDSSKRTDPAPRKLLILDLNGTLLLRSKPPPLRQDQVFSKSLKRTIFVRPYLASFREYLFHPATRRWLDVMIWSSAQPHSVHDMLQHCFPTPEGADNNNSVDERFIAVWARDTLGLSSVDYSRKTQTVKDLRKPWRKLAPSDHNDSGANHSAHTTLLVDDSPLKACLQPWNHVCVPEYNAAAHAAEVHAAADQASAQNPPDAASAADLMPSAPIDRALLAVIGILEASQPQSNAAAWIRATRLRPTDCNHGDAAIGVNTKSARPIEPSGEAVVQKPASPGLIPHKRKREMDDAPQSTAAKRMRRSRSRVPPISKSSHSSAHSTSHSLVPTTLPPSPVPQQASRPTPSTQTFRQGPDNPRNPSGTSQDAESDQSTLQWFEHAPTLAYWIAQGRAALRDRGIAETPRDCS